MKYQLQIRQIRISLIILWCDDGEVKLLAPAGSIEPVYSAVCLKWETVQEKIMLSILWKTLWKM